MKKLLLILLLLVPMAAAINETHNYNTSQIPFAGSEEIHVQLQPNATAYMQLLNKSEQLNIDYQNMTVFGGNESSRNMSINYTVEANITEDKTLEGHFLLSSNISNQTMPYNLYINLTNDIETTVELETEHFVNVMQGNYVINITTDQLPKKGTLSYKIAGLSGENLSINCSGDWLTCPSQKQFNKNNMTFFDVIYQIPESATPRNYIYNISMKSGNATLEKQIQFNVDAPDLEFKPYVFKDECYVQHGDDYLLTWECVMEQQDHMQKQMEEFYQIVQKNRTQKNDTCEPEVKKEYVVVGDVNKELKDQLDKCRNQRDNLQNKEKNCQNELNKARKALLQNETTCLKNQFQKSASNLALARKKLKASERMKQKAESIQFWAYMGPVIITAFVLLGFFGFKRYKRYKESKGELR